MKAVIESAQFPLELRAWGWRGLLCAGPSAFWAIVADFMQPAEVAAMATGVALYVAGFAWLSTGARLQDEAGDENGFLRALKMAASLKAGLAVLAGLGGALAMGLNTGLFGALAIGVLPDLWCGAAAIFFTGGLAGLHDPETLARLNSFGWTLATTLVQGAFVSLLLAGLALLVLAWRRCESLMRKANLSPVRLAD